jgi:parallel beta-helix repeat protein
VATWVVEVDFQGGAGWEDITTGVILPSFIRRRQLWNKLQPTVNTLNYQLKTESSALIAKFMTATSDILVQVTKDSAAYFTGMVQPNYSVDVGSRIKPFDVACVDNGYRLKRRIISNINWSNYKVCDPANTASSILHQLMVAAGLTASAVFSGIVTIDKTIDRFVGVAGEAEVWELASRLLFDFGYTFYFRPDGTLDVFSFAQSSIVTTDLFSSDAGDTQNIIGTLTVERSEHDYEAVRVNWSTHKTLVDALLFSDTTNGDSTRKCNIEVSSAAYWPTDSNLRDMYADYRVDGYELIATSAVVLSMEKDAAIVQDTFTDEITRAKIKYHNSGATSAYIRMFDIKGDAIVKDQYNVQTRIMSAGTNKYLDLESNYLYTAADAALLADAVAQYYYNADMRYGLRSRSEYEPGAFVYVKETGFLGINNLCVVQEVADNEWTGEHSYVLEGVAEYSAGETTSTGSAQIPTPYTRTSNVTVGASGYSGFADWYCDGTADEVQINSAIVEVNSLYGGGVVRLLGGTFVTAAAVELLDNVTLEIDPSATVEKNCDDYAIEAVGTSEAHKSNVKITGGGTITRASGDTNAIELVHFEYVDDFAIDNVTVDDSYEDGIYIINCTNGKVEAGVKISACDGTGLKIIASTVIVAAAVTITECAIGYECQSSTATDRMTDGDCESATSPLIQAGGPTLDQALWERSNTVKYAGTYSYKFTKNVAAGTPAAVYLHDSDGDMHGLTAGKSYKLKLKLYIPSGGILYTEVMALLQWSPDGMANPHGPSVVNGILPVYDAWQDVEYIIDIPSTATDNLIGFAAREAAAINEVFYVDDLYFYEFDTTDSGCQLVNSSIADCTDKGAVVSTNQAIIQNNQITGNTNAGLVIQAGYRNLVTNNRCYNNGSDTGLENTNEDNFYDAGTDTQLSGNSWQSPVTLEPSWGSKHTHVETLVNAVNPTGTGDTTVTCSNVPTGTRGIAGYFEILSASTAYRMGYIKDSDGNIWSIAYNPTTASPRGRAWFEVPLNASKQFLYSVSNADVSEFSIYMREYYI